MRTILATLSMLALFAAGCPKEEPKKEPADPGLQVLQALDQHTSAMRKILVDNRDNCDKALELYGQYVDENLQALKQLSAQSKKLMEEDKEGKYASMKQETSARSSRDLMLFYRQCSGGTYAKKLYGINQRY